MSRLFSFEMTFTTRTRRFLGLYIPFLPVFVYDIAVQSSRLTSIGNATNQYDTDAINQLLISISVDCILNSSIYEAID